MNSPQPPPPPQYEIEEVHLSDYLNVLLRRRRIFLLAFLAVFLGVALYTFTMRPIYEASATLYVKDEKSAKGGVLGDLAMLTSANPVDAEIEILKSRTNAEEVVRRLHLNWGISDRSKGLAFRIADFASTHKEPDYTVVLTGPDRTSVANADGGITVGMPSFVVKNDDGSIAAKGRVGERIRTQHLTLLFDEIQGKKDDRFRLRQHPFNDTVEKLRKAVKVNEVGKKTNVIKVTYNDTSPVMANAVVNTLVQAYLEQTLSFRTEEASNTVKFVENQLKGTRDALDQSEKNLQMYKSTSGMIKLDSEAEELVRKLSEIEKERASVVLQRNQVEFALEAQKKARRGGGVYSPAAFKDDPLIGTMAAKLTELEMQRRALVAENTERHPLVKAVQGQIDQLQRKIQSTFETARLNLTKQEATLKQQIAQYEEKLGKLPEAERTQARLMRFSKVNADIYTFLLQKHEEARIAKASTISNINIVDPAIVPDKPVKPQKGMNLLLGLLGGLILGSGAAFFKDYLDDTIKDEEEAKRALAWPMLATIPTIEGAAKDSGPVNLVVQTNPKSSPAEAFRGLRTAIHFSSLKRDCKVVMITSSFPGEGKTTIAANLALTFAQSGNRVLVVDCDLRRPGLHKVFGHSRNPGVTEVLAGDVPLAQALHATGIENIALLSAGTIPPNPAELLCSDRMRELLAGLRASYDMVILDAPPVIPVTDAPLLTALTDLVVVVVEAGRIPANAARRMKELLQSVQAPVAGFVLNDRTALFSDTYGYYGKGYYGRRYYGYATYGADDQKGKHPKKLWWKRLLNQRREARG
ncbi:polysaccharide biosynthesis tyrosine autokinase [bacterium]|nr:polysaccharide biosynthesis tyrosine autokinase [bacterium]